LFQRRRESNPDCGEAREDHLRSMARSSLSQGSPRSPEEHRGAAAHSQDPHGGGQRGASRAGDRKRDNLYGYKLPILALAGGHNQTPAMSSGESTSDGGVVRDVCKGTI